MDRGVCVEMQISQEELFGLCGVKSVEATGMQVSLLLRTYTGPVPGDFRRFPIRRCGRTIQEAIMKGFRVPTRPVSGKQLIQEKTSDG